MHHHYAVIFIFLVFLLCVASGLLCLAYFLNRRRFGNIANISDAKYTSYECGFDPHNAPVFYNINFYRLAVLFLIFDVELIFCIPWALNIRTVQIFGFGSMLCFIFILTLAFIYEWKKGVLDELV
ncbi:NADH-quinone oxidoreductase subunit A [Rickettsiales endosymbiont of Paramecium tredecaurelia]|uniref:NADH-quinone oxidoreductase subunit A n=1 Tax=Candidatus Sarmatiella mevalonica TaxID=2770581 RepID=UPI001923E1F5|nr:NADH-quinone oxidoreductase subunit A [Candidatus Sarmatiella mevalonica]MBL3284862.1 NADH-quinone oxidoreductase subunit A [Candidatus Sarmatiella mevalonica]